MTIRRTLFAGGAMLGGTELSCVILRFVRNVFIARILTPEDYGLAATLWITTDLLAMMTELGFRQRLIQSRDGDDDRVGAVAQLMLAARGFLTGLLLFVSAGAIANLFHSPEATWAFRLLALIPIMRGLEHRDLDRLQRKLDFRPVVVARLLPEVIVTFLAIPIALKTRDYRAFLYMALIVSVLRVIISHVLAKKSFRMAWDRRIAGEFLDFGWPLLINSLLMYATVQGDRVILAGAYTKYELGAYSVALTLATVSMSLFRGIIQPLMFPLMSQAQGDPVTFRRHYVLHSQLIGAIAAAVGVVCVLVGPLAVTTLYGEKYSLAATLIGFLGVRQAIQLLRTPAANAAVAKGDTRNMMYANCFRQLGTALAVLVAVFGLPVTWIACCGVIGEIAAFTATVMLLRYRHSMPIDLLARPAMFAGIGLFAASVLAQRQEVEMWSGAIGWTAAFAAAGVPLYLMLFQPLRKEIVRVNKAAFSRASTA